MSITVQLPTPHHRSRAEVRAQNCWPPRPARCLLSSKDILRTAVQNRTPASTLTLAPSILLLSGLDAGLWHWSSRLQNQFPRLSPGPRSAGLDVDRVKVLDVGLSTGPEVYSTGSRSAVLDVGLQHSMSGPQGQTSGPGTGSRVRRSGHWIPGPRARTWVRGTGEDPRSLCAFIQQTRAVRPLGQTPVGGRQRLLDPSAGDLRLSASLRDRFRPGARRKPAQRGGAARRGCPQPQGSDGPAAQPGAHARAATAAAGAAPIRRKRKTRTSGRPVEFQVPGFRVNESGWRVSGRRCGGEQGHGEAAAGPERPGRRGAGPDCAGREPAPGPGVNVCWGGTAQRGRLGLLYLPR